MRTIELDLVNPISVPSDKLFNAIGYLTTWNTGYPLVRIYNEGDSLTGHYFRRDESHAYTIGAIWDGENYSFNS
jgi:hypothetical protein